MQIQYIREGRDGSRTHVSEWEWLTDRATGSYRSLHQFGAIVIYEVKG